MARFPGHVVYGSVDFRGGAAADYGQREFMDNLFYYCLHDGGFTQSSELR